MTTNLIEGIKMMKLYGWEKPFVKLIKIERLAEIKGFLKLSLLQVRAKVLSFRANRLCVLVPMIVYVY